MARKLKPLHIDRDLGHTWLVYVDAKYDAQIATIEGIADAFRDDRGGILYVKIDPRFDPDDVEREITELCR